MFLPAEEPGERSETVKDTVKQMELKKKESKKKSCPGLIQLCLVISSIVVNDKRGADSLIAIVVYYEGTTP